MECGIVDLIYNPLISHLKRGSHARYKRGNNHKRQKREHKKAQSKQIFMLFVFPLRAFCVPSPARVAVGRVFGPAGSNSRYHTESCGGGKFFSRDAGRRSADQSKPSVE